MVLGSRLQRLVGIHSDQSKGRLFDRAYLMKLGDLANGHGTFSNYPVILYRKFYTRCGGVFYAR